MTSFDNPCETHCNVDASCCPICLMDEVVRLREGISAFLVAASGSAGNKSAMAAALRELQRLRDHG